MKKFIVIVILTISVLTGFVILKDRGYNPYSGTYIYTGQGNLILKLKNDNTYILYYPVGRRDDFVKGEYEVKDNNIALTPDKDNINKIMSKALHGKVEGSKISLVEYDGDFLKH